MMTQDLPFPDPADKHESSSASPTAFVRYSTTQVPCANLLVSVEKLTWSARVRFAEKMVQLMRYKPSRSRVDDQKSRLKLQLDTLKLKPARERAEQQAKKEEDERVEPRRLLCSAKRAWKT
jgi:hypothetical protein